MEPLKIKKILIKSIVLQEVYVTGEKNNFQIIAVSEKFINMSQLKRHRLIYDILMEYILDNRIHALSIKAFTPKEWNNNLKLNFKF